QSCERDYGKEPEGEIGRLRYGFNSQGPGLQLALVATDHVRNKQGPRAIGIVPRIAAETDPACRIESRGARTRANVAAIRLPGAGELAAAVEAWAASAVEMDVVRSAVGQRHVESGI